MMWIVLEESLHVNLVLLVHWNMFWIGQLLIEMWIFLPINWQYLTMLTGAMTSLKSKGKNFVKLFSVGTSTFFFSARYHPCKINRPWQDVISIVLLVRSTRLGLRRGLVDLPCWILAAAGGGDVNKIFWQIARLGRCPTPRWTIARFLRRSAGDWKLYGRWGVSAAVRTKGFQ